MKPINKLKGCFFKSNHPSLMQESFVRIPFSKVDTRQTQQIIDDDICIMQGHNISFKMFQCEKKKKLKLKTQQHVTFLISPFWTIHYIILMNHDLHWFQFLFLIPFCSILILIYIFLLVQMLLTWFMESLVCIYLLF